MTITSCAFVLPHIIFSRTECEEDAPQVAKKTKSQTGIVYHPDYLKHKTRLWHPEHPGRLTAIIDQLKVTEFYEQLVFIDPIVADVEHLSLVHSEEYIHRVKKICQAGGGPLDTGDTPVGRESYDVARLAVGGAMAAVDAVMAGVIKNAFCLVRPPGHHATPSMGMGFCIFNNIAIAARYLQKQHNVAKVLIVDWDVHHGNGTQNAFYNDASVLYFSVHRGLFYPGTGWSEERGKGAGEGLTINAPLQYGASGATYLQVFDELLLPAADNFKPDFILISAGFDAHEMDPLGGMSLTTEDFSHLADTTKRLAEKHCGGRLVAMLEGGYDLEALANSVVEVLRIFLVVND